MEKRSAEWAKREGEEEEEEEGKEEGNEEEGHRIGNSHIDL